MKRRRILIIVLALVAAGAGWLIYRATRPRAPGATASVYRGTIKATLDCLGTVQVQRAMDVSPLVSGRVSRIAVVEGDRVVSGTLLLELDNPDVRELLAQAERALALRELQLEEALKAPDQASIDLAVARLRQATVLRQRAQQDYDAIAGEPDAESSDEAVALEAAKLEYETAQAQYDQTMRGASELELEQLRASVEDARDTVANAKERVAQLCLYAPMDGTVMRIDTRVGENVNAYSPVVQVADLTHLEIHADVNELDIAFDSRESNVRPGMSANITIATRVLEDVLLIPRRAVRSVGDSDVVRVVEGRRTRDVVIVTGLSDANEVQVISGLEEGQQVLLP